jgi:hypothetical protein
VHAGAADAQRLLIQLAGYGLGKSFVFCQRGSPDSALSGRCPNF